MGSILHRMASNRIALEGLLNAKGKRLLALSEALEKGGTMEELAALSGSSLRNVYRDIVHLRGMGLNIVKRKGRYYIGLLLLVCLSSCLSGCYSYHDVTHSEGYGKWKKTQQHNLRQY